MEMEKEGFKNGRCFEGLFFNGIIAIVGNDWDVTQNHTKVSCDCHSKLFCQNMNNAETCSNANEKFGCRISKVVQDLVRHCTKTAFNLFQYFFFLQPANKFAGR